LGVKTIFWKINQTTTLILRNRQGQSAIQAKFVAERGRSARPEALDEG
jgi:hypothetical protein